MGNIIRVSHCEPPAPGTPDKYGVYWYNETEILNWTDADFEARAAEFAADGVNIVMTFSCTHFRWSFQPWWPQINEAIGKIVRACHKYGIRVVEHHSTHLTHNPRSAAEWESVADKFRVRKSRMEMFPGLREHIAWGDPEIRPGVHLSDCRQIDGRTGDFARTNYTGYGHCFNHPDFRAAYFDYLESVYRTGVDGIMTDDVQFFGFGNACACPACRRKFHEKTGYELPPPEKWGEFFHNYDDPVYIAFLRFRMESTAEFQREVNRHFRSLGLELLRPNYVDNTLTPNTTGYPFEAAGELWSCVFQENTFSRIIRTSWPDWAGNAAQRRAMSRLYHVPSMSMFYPAREDDLYFCWALARSWGQLLMATPEGGRAGQTNPRFIPFEAEHPATGFEAEAGADIAFLEVRSSLDYCEKAIERSYFPFSVWSQAALFRNFGISILLEKQSAETWNEHSLIVLAGAVMLSDEQLEALRRYVDGGGRLLLTGDFGSRRADGTKREHPERIFGLDAELSDFGPVAAGAFRWNGQTVKLPALAESRQLRQVAAGEVVAQSEAGEILGIASPDHRVVWLAGGVNTCGWESAQFAQAVSRWEKDAGRKIPASPYVADYLRTVPGGILALLMEKPPRLQIDSTDHTVSAFVEADGTLAIHLVNVGGTIPRPPERVGHPDIFANFVPQAPGNTRPLNLIVRLPSDAPRSPAQAYSPEFSGGKALETVFQNGEARILIPAGTFAGYLRIELRQA